MKMYFIQNSEKFRNILSIHIINKILIKKRVQKEIKANLTFRE